MNNKKKVLVIEDNPDNLFLIKYFLQDHNFIVEEATDGKEGLEKIKIFFPDMVILDIMMPLLNGYEVAMAIRNDKSFKDIPIIALTAKAMKGDKEKCLEVGCTDYISKPVNLNSLLELIDKYLKFS